MEKNKLDQSLFEFGLSLLEKPSARDLLTMNILPGVIVVGILVLSPHVNAPTTFAQSLGFVLILFAGWGYLCFILLTLSIWERERFNKALATIRALDLRPVRF